MTRFLILRYVTFGIMLLPFTARPQAASKLDASLATFLAAPETGDGYIRSDVASAAATAVKEATAIVGDANVSTGLIVDVKSSSIYLLGEISDMKPGDTVEFYTTYYKSGNGHETIFYSYALPSQVHKALETIKTTQGHPVDPSKLVFWPRGGRVAIEVNGADGKGWVPIHDLTKSKNLDMKDRSFIFTGARDDERDGSYMADGRQCSIIANYNELDSVLSVPFNRPQEAVYGEQSYDKEKVRPEGQPVVIRIRPWDKPVEIEQNLHLLASSKDPKELEFRLEQKDQEPITGSFGEVVKSFEAQNELGQEAHVTIQYGDGITLSALSRLVQGLQQMDRPDGIRVAPPAAGTPYYKAFAPPEAYRQRERRFTQPDELHLLTGELVSIREDRDEDRNAILKTTEHKVATPADLAGAFEKMPKRQAAFVYAEGGMTYGEMKIWLEPLLERYSVLFIYKVDKPIDPVAP